MLILFQNMGSTPIVGDSPTQSPISKGEGGKFYHGLLIARKKKTLNNLKFYSTLVTHAQETTDRRREEETDAGLYSDGRARAAGRQTASLASQKEITLWLRAHTRYLRRRKAGMSRSLTSKTCG
jgi:hypothetical protein